MPKRLDIDAAPVTAVPVADSVKVHFVRFYSPGTFVAEQTEKLIESWDVEKAKEMARNIKERYGACPYGFQFTTRERSGTDLDSHESAHSPMYFWAGRWKHWPK